MMASDNKRFRKEKEIQLECENHMKDIRAKLDQQLKTLEEKLTCQNAMVLEIQDFFRKRSEIELEYSQKLDKLAKGFLAKQKAEKQKREPWAIFSTYTCWQHLLGITRQQSKDHAVISDVYGSTMCNRLSDITEDCRRLFTKCKEVALVSHDEILKVLNELQSDMKLYHVYRGEVKHAEAKLKHAEEQKMKVEQQATKGSKKVKALEKQLEKRQAKYTDNKLKSLKARNEYLLSIDAANNASHKYFVDDLSLLIDCMDFGYHNAMQRSMLMYNSTLDNLKNSHQASIDCIVKCVQELDPNKDKQNFLKGHSSVFSLPKRFEYQPHKGDEITQVSAQKPVQDDLLLRYQQLHNRLDSLKLENEETWKSVEEVDKNLIDMINVKDYDMTESFKTDIPVPKSPTTVEVRKKRVETEKYYFEKFNKYLLDSNLIARLHAKHTTLMKALGDDATNAAGGPGSRPPSLPPKPNKPRRIGKTPIVGQPKVFGCVLEEYIEATNEAIPLVMRSCVRAINLYGMHHEGVFRVSGLQVEINEIKATFEKGLDPLSDVTDANSINSIAGVLKSFFRELQDPLFPITLFDTLVEAARLEDSEAKLRVKDLLHTISVPRAIVMRYLFAFLNHLSQYSDENLMYPYNLAVCFGPTLLPIPGDKDQVTYQSNVNDLIKLIIVHCDYIFPKEDPGPVYERILLDPGIAFIRQSEAKFVICLSKWSKAYRDRQSGNAQWPSYKIWLNHGDIKVSCNDLTKLRDRDEGDGSEDEHSEEDAEVFEAIAAYDFERRSERELSFKKGDTLILYNQVSADWWEGAHQGKEGLIPDKYIHLRRDDSLPSTPSSSLPPKMSQSLKLEPEGSRIKGEGDKRRSVDSALSSASTSSLDVVGRKQSGQWEKASSTSNIAITPSPNSERRRLSPPLEKMEPVVKPVTPPPKRITPPPKRITPPILEKPAQEEPSTSTEQMNEDIDNALAEVMSNLESLTSKQTAPTVTTTAPKTPPPSRVTPDLVQDLPVENSGQISPVANFSENSAVMSQSTSAAETFANSDGTIVRMKSSSMPRTGASFPVASAATTKELSSFKRSATTTAAMSQREGRPVAVAEPMQKPRLPSVTGNAIHVSGPSIPALLDLSHSQSEPSTPSLPASSSEITRSTDDISSSVSGKGKRIPPPVRQKPKPSVLPKPPKKPEGSTSTTV